MKITVNREQLEKKLQSAVALIGTKSMIPILDYGLIQVTEKRIIITTSDDSATIRTFLNHNEVIGDKFDFVCDINIILRTISMLKNELIILNVGEENITLSTPKTRKRYQIPIMDDPSSFPVINNDDFKKPIIVNGKSTSDMIKKASSIVNQNDLRSGMQGINFKVSDGNLSIQSTNGHVCADLNLETNNDEINFGPVLIPKAISKIIDNFTRSQDLEVSISKDERNIKLYDGSTTAYVRLVDGKFPNIDALIKQSNDKIATTMDREELMLAIKRSSIYSNRSSKMIILDGKGENIIIKGEDIDFRRSSDELVETEIKASEMNFESAFNSDFLVLILGNLLGDKVIFSQISNNQPSFFMDNSSDSYHSRWLLAPMVINQ